MDTPTHVQLHRGRFIIHVLPRQKIAWADLPDNSIAFDGIVNGGPLFDPIRRCVNFDHHDGVVREATMSTCMQVLFAIKGGLMSMFPPGSTIHLYVNDTDQDTSLAIFLVLENHQFTGTKSIPAMSRLIALTDRLDVTGGAFPMDLSDSLLGHHLWVFEHYARSRTSGALAVADAFALTSNLEATLGRLKEFMMGDAGIAPLNKEHRILFDHPRFKIVDEIGGNDARYYLFSHGMDAFISIVARRPDGRMVMSIGRRSRYIPFPVHAIYDRFNKEEGRTRENGFDGSDIVGGSSRLDGTGLTWEKQRDLALEEIEKADLGLR
ncbi:hypothetical protein A2318_04640 [Candidatus Uhrbacteria bacterium RIFOXYB2_FULL_45_11]|uniref:Uncharacterized protein n=1 Tax=Candidatus Uhrbacteria bacterium RIFOXYB2_FULL_45_11 TaxID=1802421 RepID=A0A1F7W2U5_9BACT|nr:MAG: hypothetical protein A2318_04640 [Candidatus Uhrbacteria bacterium RIFOXYB2_FULL_45_11]